MILPDGAKPVAGILEGSPTGCKPWGRQMRCCWARFSAGCDVYRHGRPGEQSGVCVWRWSADTQTYAPMAAIMAAGGMVPPLALGLA